MSTNVSNSLNSFLFFSSTKICLSVMWILNLVRTGCCDGQICFFCLHKIMLEQQEIWLSAVLSVRNIVGTSRKALLNGSRCVMSTGTTFGSTCRQSC